MEKLYKEAVEEIEKDDDKEEAKEEAKEEEITFNEVNGWNYKLLKYIQGTIQY